MTTQNFTFIEIDTSDCQEAVADLRDLRERNEAAQIRVVLTEQGQLNISANRSNAGTAQREWHGVDQAFTLHAQSAQFLERFLTSKKVQTLLRQLHSGHDVEWDGHNYVGVLDEEGQDACERLHRLFDEYEIKDNEYFMEYEFDYEDDSNSED